MGKLIDISGIVYGDLTAIKYIKTVNNRSFWEFKCVCGNIKTINTMNVKQGTTKSCGCYRGRYPSVRAVKHGMGRTSTYYTWSSMIQRCINKNNNNYKNYGGRGIDVCDKWRKFEGFYEDMGARPLGLQIDRIDNNSGYFKDNCQWVAHIENTRNRRSTRLNTEVVKVIKYFLKNSGISPTKLAKVHNLPSSLIYNIKYRNSWKDITID